MQNPKCAAAGFGTRWIAYIIDCLIIGIISGLVLLPAAMDGLFSSSSIWTRQVLFDLTVYGITAYCIRAVYFVICTYAFGKTLGKMILRIHVESADEKKLTFVNVLFRETVGRFLSGIFYVGYLIALAGKEHLALHDMLCDTRVRYTNLAEIVRIQVVQPGPAEGMAVPQMYAKPDMPQQAQNSGGYVMPQKPQQAQEPQVQSHDEYVMPQNQQQNRDMAAEEPQQFENEEDK